MSCITAFTCSSSRFVLGGRINREKVDNPRHFLFLHHAPRYATEVYFTSVWVYDNSLLNMNDKSCLPLPTPVLLRGQDDIWARVISTGQAQILVRVFFSHLVPLVGEEDNDLLSKCSMALKNNGLRWTSIGFFDWHCLFPSTKRQPTTSQGGLCWYCM